MNNVAMVSVIIPNYNHEAFLSKRIETVLNQSFQDFELILLDDASTDDSESIIKQYAAHPKVVQVQCNSDNSGSVFKQWIKGIQLSKGEFIWIAESDDYSDLTFLEKTIEVLRDSKNLGMVFTDSFKVDENERQIGLVSSSKKGMKTLIDSNRLINKTNCTRYLLENLVVVNASSVLFRKSALLRIDFSVLQKLKNLGDVFVYVGITLNYDAYFLPKPLNFMRLHERNTTKINKRIGRIYEDKIIILDRYLDDLNQSESMKVEIINFLLSFIFLSIDFGYFMKLKQLITKMCAKNVIDRRKYYVLLFVIYFYRFLMYKGRPQFLREGLKSFLNKRF